MPKWYVKSEIKTVPRRKTVSMFAILLAVPSEVTPSAISAVNFGVEFISEAEFHGCRV
jgi:hypothetical protein